MKYDYAAALVEASEKGLEPVRWLIPKRIEHDLLKMMEGKGFYKEGKLHTEWKLYGVPVKWSIFAENPQLEALPEAKVQYIKVQEIEVTTNG